MVHEHPIVSVKGVKVTDFAGRSLSSLSSSQLDINPPLEETQVLRSWYDTVGSGMQFVPVGQGLARGGGAQGGDGSGGRQDVRKTMQDANAMRPMEGKTEWYSTRATVAFVKPSPEGWVWFPACPKEDCGRKVQRVPRRASRCVCHVLTCLSVCL